MTDISATATKRMPKILIAEDDEDLRKVLCKALVASKFDVTDVGDGLSAFNALQLEPFDLLLTDIAMPEMGGIELARQAAKLDSKMRIMFITGFAAVALTHQNHIDSPTTVLSKPFHLNELVDQVKATLELTVVEPND